MTPPDPIPPKPRDWRPHSAGAGAAPLPGLAPGPAAALARERGLRLLALLPSGVFLAVLLAPPLNHDVAAVLNFSERWLAGEALYRDLIDVNPPLVFVLNLLPAAIGTWTPLTAVQGLQLCLLALCALACWLAARLRPRPEEAPVQSACLAAGLPLLCLAAGYDAGQREHVMAVAAFPWLLLAARRAAGEAVAPPLAIGVTLLAAIGFALKPHFLAIPALVEAWLLLRRGPARALADPLPWLMAGTWLLYLAAIPLLFPAYFGHVLPLVWDYYLGIGGLAWWQVLLADRLGPVLLLLGPLLLLAFRPGGATLPRLAGLAALGAVAAAVVQHKGWSYHLLPARLFTGLLALLLVARWLDAALAPQRARRAAPAIAAAATLALGIHNLEGAEAPWRQITWSWSRGGAITDLLKRQAYGERLLVLSPDVFPVHPALNYARAQSTLRSMTLWLLQGVYQQCPANGARYRETWEMPRTEFFVYRTVAEDFARAPPAALLVAMNSGIPRCGREFDFIEYFSRHPLFAESFRRYRLTAELEGYRLYQRED